MTIASQEDVIGMLKTLKDAGIVGFRATTQLVAIATILSDKDTCNHPVLLDLRIVLGRESSIKGILSELSEKHVTGRDLISLFGLECYTAASVIGMGSH